MVPGIIFAFCGALGAPLRLKTDGTPNETVILRSSNETDAMIGQVT